MPDDSNGIYNVPAGTLVNTGDTVLPSQHNPWANDSSAAISNRYSKDGRAPLTGNMNVNGFSLQNLASPVASGDATNKGYVDGQITSVNQNAEKISTKSANYTALLADKATSFRFTASATLALTPAATLLNNWWCEVWATNGNVIIDPDSAETINGAATLILQTGQAAKIFCTGTAFFAWIFSDSRTGPQLQGYSFGLGLTTNATDAANDVDIAVGSATADVSPYGLMQLATALTKRIDAAWAVGNNNGGLDTGTVAAAGTYYIWLIQRSDTLVTDALFSLSSTAPTMPANYDRKRLLNWYVIRSSSVNSEPLSYNMRQSRTDALLTLTAAANDFTGISSTVNKITIDLASVTTSANTVLIIQLGTSGGIVTNGYNGIGSSITGGSTSSVAYSDSFRIGASTQAYSSFQGGQVVIDRVSGNTWSLTLSGAEGTNVRLLQGAGSVSLAAALTQFRVTTVSGTAIISGTVRVKMES